MTKILDSKSASDLVKEFHNRFCDLEEELLNDVDNRQRWLIRARFINSIFNAHYNMTVKTASEVYEYVEKSDKL